MGNLNLEDVAKKMCGDTNWREAPYGIREFEGFEHYVLFDRNYTPIAELPDLQEADLRSLHTSLAGEFQEGCAYFYNDSTSEQVAEAPEYKDVLKKLQSLTFRIPVVSPAIDM